MPDTTTNTLENHVKVHDPVGRSSVVLVCEHASHYIPAAFNDLGLAPADRQSHAAWDPGALAVAKTMALHMNAGLVAGGVSRLVYDCNRPPHALDAMPARSEVIDVPGNQGLSQSERDARTAEIYTPFHGAVRQMLAATTAPVLVTVHSFTPLYHAKPRQVEIGILHDADSRLADAMLDVAGDHTDAKVRRNEPYGPQDGVTHTLKEHALQSGYLNVMIEVRNDLIQTPTQQSQMARTLATWIAAACDQLQLTGDVACHG